jgi:hypothetical protein
MNYQEFKRRIEVLVDFYKKQDEAGKTLCRVLCMDGNIMDFGSELATAYTKMLQEAVGDEDDWIGYWLWECDMGKKKMGWSKDGVDYDIKSIRSLYDAIQMNKTK